VTARAESPRLKAALGCLERGWFVVADFDRDDDHAEHRDHHQHAVHADAEITASTSTALTSR
jgi:hypothetical protein